MSEPATNEKSPELFKTVQKKRRRVRISQNVFAFIVITLLMATILLATKTLQHVEKQQDQLSAAVAELKHNTDTGLQKANAHLDCIAQFFAQTNRTSKTLLSLDSCNIVPVSQAPSSSSTKTSTTTTSQPSSSGPQAAAIQSTPPSPSDPPRQNLLQKVGQSISDIMESIKRSL